MLSARNTMRPSARTSVRPAPSCAVLLRSVTVAPRRGRPLPPARTPRVTVAAAYRLAPPSNPAFRFGRLDEALSYSASPRGDRAMTLDGTVGKAAALLALTFVAAAATWMQAFSSGTVAGLLAVMGATKLAGVGALVAAVASMFKPQWAPVTAPVYALCQGAALAGMSAFLELRYAGIAMNAVLLTFGTAASCMAALRAGLVRVDEGFVSTVRTVMGGYIIALLAGWLASMAGLQLPSLFSSGPIGIAVGLVSAGLAAANLLIDFSFLSDASRQRGLPKWMEWYGAQSVMITLSWLYIDMLRLLANFAGMRFGDSD